MSFFNGVNAVNAVNAEAQILDVFCFCLAYVCWSIVAIGIATWQGNMWEMMNLLEQSLRVPLLIRPAPSDSRFTTTVPIYNHPVELLDLFPTLATLAGLPPPPVAWQLPGTDLTRGMVNGGKKTRLFCDAIVS